MFNPTNKINSYLEKFNIDDAAVSHEKGYMIFKNVGKIKTTSASTVLFYNELYLKYFDWQDLFDSEGNIKVYMSKYADKINQTMIDKRIDDFVIGKNGRFVHFKNNGIVNTKSVSLVLYGSGLHLQHYKWTEMFDEEGNIKDEIRKKIKSIIGRNGALAMHQKPNKQYPKGMTPWNKGMKMTTPVWCQGKTKHEHPSLMRLSESRKGANNPCHRMTEETKEAAKSKQSKTMRRLIAEGTFTPNTENRLYKNNNKLLYNNINYRSSWELAFHLLNPEYEYETLRIEYTGIDNKKRVYIIDFVDHINKTVYEVKPENLFFIDKNKSKEDALIEWCKINGYKYNRFTQHNLCINRIELKLLIETIDDQILKTTIMRLLKDILK